MEVSQGLLVAMMFITVLSIGIGNILMGLSAAVDQRTEVRFGRISGSWLLLLLLIHFNLFWHTLAILDRASWAFFDFLAIESGPVLLLLATGIMVPVAGSGNGDESHYFLVARRFFTILGGVMLWAIGADLLLGNGFGAASVWNLVSFAAFVALAATSSHRVHAYGTAGFWIVLLSAVLARGFGVFG